MKLHAAAIGILAVLAGGCTTTLESTKPPGIHEIARGIEYRLPETQIEVEANWALVDCKTITFTRDPNDAGALTSAKIFSLESGTSRFLRKFEGGEIRTAALASDGIGWPKVNELGAQMEIVLKPTATYAARTIEGERLLIDYEKLTEAFKTGSITAEYYSDTLILKSINAKLEGQEGEALKSAIGFAGNVARIAFGLGGAVPAGAGPAAAGDVSVTMEQCTERTKGLVRQRNDVLKSIKDNENKLKLIGAKIGEINVKLATGTLDEAAIEALKALLKGEKGKLETVDGTLKAQKEALAYLNGKLSVSAKQMVGQSGSFRTTIQPSVESLEETFSGAFEESEPDFPSLANEVRLLASILPQQQGEPICDGDGASVGCSVEANKSFDGIVYRSAVPARLEVTTTGKDHQEVLKKSLRVIQLGRLQLLPLKNKFAESNSLEVLFDQAGTPSKVSYEKTKSGAKEALDLLTTASGEVLKVQQEVAAYKKAKLDAEKALAGEVLTELQRKRDLLKTQQEIDTLTSPKPSEIAVLEAEVDMLTLKAKIAQLEKQIREAEDDE
ncbi:hypothetical protein K3181_01325 [Qipengyuania sp. YG27]|uniref:Uncharacterized protein n=1 Tax=Qipengyuania mesophila TaxID=2867246 RepID=A0ABS7JR14_9SPHN|nr:hypothetical protein [Qipengyuania mesophila]MBX7500081.1 hypothetical protein [Qipengyuania mesophila]